MIDVTCALIINDAGEVLVAQRSALMKLPLKWELPGGKIEAGETAEECLVREIKEELNLKIEIRNNLHPNVHSYTNITINLIPFVCKIIGGEIQLKEHSVSRWLNLNDLLDLDWAEADIPIIKNYLNNLDAIA